MLRLKMIGEERKERASGTYNDPLHREIILECAEESIILLKNEDNRLPLKIRNKYNWGYWSECRESSFKWWWKRRIKALCEISPIRS